MSQLAKSVLVEWYKVKKSAIAWVTIIAFALGPVMGGLIIFMLGHADQALEGSMLMEKAKMMSFEVNWTSYLSLLSQVVGVGGVLVFGFIASWIFGREYSDKTVNDLLALPTSRSTILNAKFILYVFWCLTLVIINFILGIFVGKLVGLGALQMTENSVGTYLITTFLVILLGTPISFFALWGQGYLAPLGFVTLTLVFSQIIGAIGYGHYFPWALPGLYSGSAGVYKETIDGWSYFILATVTIAGFALSHFWWNKAEQH
jgi:ABC-2 type transport system permease protein